MTQSRYFHKTAAGPFPIRSYLHSGLDRARARPSARRSGGSQQPVGQAFICIGARIVQEFVDFPGVGGMPIRSMVRDG